MVLQKPSQSPDLNRTEMLRRDLKRPANELKQRCTEKWDKIPPQ